VVVSTTDVAGNPNTAATGQTSYTVDNTEPAAPNAPAAPAATAAVDGLINQVEEAAGFPIRVALGTSGAVAGDVLELLRGGVSFPTPIRRTLTPTDITAGTCDFTINSGQLGSDGTKQLTARVTDIAGNPGIESSALSLTLDTTNPAVLLSSTDSDGAVRDADTVVITATFTEGGSGIDETVGLAPEITIGSLVVGVPMSRSSNLVWTYSWNVPSGNNGPVTVSVSATDVAGNANTPATGQTSFTVDNIAPTVVLTDNHGDSIVRNADTVLITATFTEGGSGIDETVGLAPEITIGSLVVGVPMSRSSNLVWTYSWNVPSGNNGPVTVSVSAADVAGNSNTPATGQTSYTIDNIAPTVVLSDDHDDSIVRDANTVLITATFTEADQIDESPEPEITIGTLVVGASMNRSSNLVWTYSWNVPSGNNGPVTISVSATDRAGNPNTAATGQTSYTIDNTDPLFASTNPVVLAGDYSYADVTFSENVYGDNSHSTAIVNGDLDLQMGSGATGVIDTWTISPAHTPGSDTLRIAITWTTSPESGDEVIVEVSNSYRIYDTAGNDMPNSTSASGFAMASSKSVLYLAKAAVFQSVSSWEM
jgi:hypothetical protein